MPLSKVVRNLGRSQEIFAVLFRHGFGDLLQRMGLLKYLRLTWPGHKGREVEPPALKTPAQRFRQALEDLGGGFVKLGQLLSTRADILPKNWIEELSHLQDEVAPLEFDQLLTTLEFDLGPLADKFRFLDPNPLASASIAQVHAGITRDGNEVVVKIRKPGTKKTLLQDLDILQALAELLARHVPESSNYRPVQLVEEYRAALKRELDFALEGRNLDRFRSDFEAYPGIVFPKPHWELTAERVLTMDRIRGTKISLITALPGGETVARRIAETLAEAILRQILEFGFFHGDPHPGNLMLLDGEKVCFLDCGLVGQLDERMRENLIALVWAGIRREVDVVADILIQMNAVPEDLDRTQFLREGNLFLDRFYRLPLKQIHISSIVEEVMHLINKFGIQVPSDLLLVGKALITLEGVGRSLDPDFDAVEVVGPFVGEIALTHYGPKLLRRRLLEGSRDILRLLRDLPGDLREISRTLRENQFKIIVEHKGPKGYFRDLDRASKRMATSIIIAALVIASGMIITPSGEPRFMGLPIIGIIGLALAAALWLWLVFDSFWRR
ncbi:MAG: AarF/ABC1/UbiB kinase family protein [Desulfomonile tiedjei]|nr:AarF/ABC1/UbiB kinase family protein [Desulfomonile tiedjei]